MNVVLTKDGHVTVLGKRIGTWERHYNGRVDRGVKLGDWSGCLLDGRESPVVKTRRELTYWFVRQLRKGGAA